MKYTDQNIKISPLLSRNDVLFGYSSRMHSFLRDKLKEITEKMSNHMKISKNNRITRTPARFIAKFMGSRSEASQSGTQISFSTTGCRRSGYKFRVESVLVVGDLETIVKPAKHNFLPNFGRSVVGGGLVTEKGSVVE